MATIQELENQLAATKSEATKTLLKAEIQKLRLLEKSSSGDEVAQMLLSLKSVLEKTKTSGGGGNATVDKAEVETIVKDALAKNKIKLEDMDDELRNALTNSMKVSLTITTPTFASSGGSLNMALYKTALFQKILSDSLSMNNIYLFGGAGTGKTYIAGRLAKFLNYDYIELTCNQFTSPLEILGGQTITGYQPGKLERAWGNLSEDGKPSGVYNGAVLCLDELPKLDPNTAGILNGALAKVKDYDPDPLNPQGSIAPYIENGKGDKIYKKNLIIIGTGNLKLNEVSTEYEANFKQDLSLQDRFAGSTYEVTVNYEYEFNEIMKGFAFIWIPMTKLREKIVEKRWTSFAFVSLRIMVNLKETYITYREAIEHTLNANQKVKDALQNPKTIVNGVDSFLNLFKPDQIEELKLAMDYKNFLKIVKEKNNLPIGKLNTPEEITEAQVLIDANKKMLASKTA